MREIKYAILLLKDYFRKNKKTTWGKNELVKELDEIEERLITEVSK